MKFKMQQATYTVTDSAILVPHNGSTEWSVCGECGRTIDWTNNVMFGPGSGRDEDDDDDSCPSCGHDDTAYLDADLAKLSAAELDEVLEAITQHHGTISEDIIAAYDGLAERIKAGPTNWSILVSDGSGGEDWFELEGDVDDALAHGEQRAQKIKYDFGEDDEGELEISVRPGAADKIELGKSAVTRHRPSR